jgi:hypothetical protein
MNYDELLEKHDALALIELLSETCKVRRPRMRFSGRRGTRGSYIPCHRTIRVSKTPALWVLVHEFTHHLNHVENGDHGNEARESHSQAFYYKLRRLTAMLGGQYPWHREYRQLKRWAEAERLLGKADEPRGAA